MQKLIAYICIIVLILTIYHSMITKLYIKAHERIQLIRRQEEQMESLLAQPSSDNQNDGDGIDFIY